MVVKPIRALKDNYIWAILDDEEKRVLIVDPGESQPVIDFIIANHLTLDAILITHHHADHCDGVDALVHRYHVPVYGPLLEKIPLVTHPLQDNAEISFPHFGLNFHIMHIPGHTKGHIAYVGNNILFCGAK